MIVVFDLETTGVYHTSDKIVQIGAVKVDENFTEQDRFTQLINPGKPIPQGAIDVHHITDEDVKDSPKFAEVADDVLEFLGDCDLGGYNVLSFDLPMLMTELGRCGRQLELGGRRIFDAYAVFRKYEKRDLASAFRTYCQEEIGDNAHDAMVDTLATVSIIESQLTYYKNHKEKIEGFDDLAKASMGDRLTIDGKIVWNEDNEACLSFGKNKGNTLKWHHKFDQSYLRWVLKGSFADDVKDLVNEALRGHFPKREDDAGSEGEEGKEED